jgi:hypothetical protein
VTKIKNLRVHKSSEFFDQISTHSFLSNNERAQRIYTGSFVDSATVKGTDDLTGGATDPSARVCARKNELAVLSDLYCVVYAVVFRQVSTSSRIQNVKNEINCFICIFELENGMF